MSEYKAIETVYGGVRYRSKNEAKWALFFDLVGICYEYEPVTVTGMYGIKYRPDFWFPEYGRFAEVKSSDEGIHNPKMAQKLEAAIDWNSTEVSKGLLLLGNFPFDVRVLHASLLIDYLFCNKGVCLGCATIKEDEDGTVRIHFNDDFIRDVGAPIPDDASTTIGILGNSQSRKIHDAIMRVNDHFNYAAKLDRSIVEAVANVFDETPF